MKIGIVTPAPPRSLRGNRVTAVRWAKLLKQLGHRVAVVQSYDDQPFDVMIALHANRSFDSIRQFHREQPGRPVIVALTGTDLYRDLGRIKRTQLSLEMAARLVVLQPKAIDDVPPHLQHKARVIYQSVEPFRPNSNPKPQTSNFQVCVIGHLREVKDPFRAAMAARLLPAKSRVQIVHIGTAMNERMTVGARREMHVNARYRWLGEQTPNRTRQILMRSQLTVNSSRVEGGANAVSESIVAGVPVIASHIAGNVGLLGDDYPGYFRAGDTRGLAALLWKAETDEQFLGDLRAACRLRATLFRPERERETWADLLSELTYR